MGFVLGKNSLRYLSTLESETLKQAVKDFIKVSPIDFGIIKNGAYRSAEDQHALYQQHPKVTDCDGYTYISNHQTGLAVDLIPWVDGKFTWDKKATFYLAGAFKMFCRLKHIKITSGADWNGDGNLLEGDSWDSCHFEVKE